MPSSGEPRAAASDVAFRQAPPRRGRRVDALTLTDEIEAGYQELVGVKEMMERKRRALRMIADSVDQSTAL